MIGQQQELQTDRRFVTVLFADLSGFTSLAEKLDPEEIQHLLNDCFDLLVPLIEKQGGTIDKFIGDEVMAVFGAPQAMENSARAAMNAALDMLEAMEQFKLKRTQSLGIHIGINSGMVVAGGIGSKGRMQYTVIGDAVNLAARLTSISPENTIYVGKETFLQAEKNFVFSKLAPTAIKGKQEKIQYYQLLAKAHSRNSHEQFIGREKEIKEILNFSLKKNVHRLRLIGIYGHAGVGKSVLVKECSNQLKKDFILIQAAPGISHFPKPFETIRNVLTSWLKVTDISTYSQLFNTLQTSLDHYYFQLSYEELQLINQFLKPNTELPANSWLSDPNWTGKLSNTLVTLINKLLQVQKVWIQLENFSAMDSYSVEILKFCLNPDLKTKSIICLESRNWEMLNNLINTGQGFPANQFLKIELKSLTDAEAETLLLSQLPDFSIDPINLEEIIRKAEGNPLYLSSLTTSYKSASSIQTAKTIKLQPFLFQELGTIVLDSLKPDERNLICTASVIGREFSLKNLKFLMQDRLSVKELEPLIQNLINKGFLTNSKPGHLAFVKDYIFQSAYSYFLLSERKKLHQKLANLLASQAGPNSIEILSEIAYQLEKSGNIKKALEYYVDANKKYFKSGLFKESYLISEKINELISTNRAIIQSKNQRITHLIQFAELNHKFLQIEKGIDCIHEALSYCKQSDLKLQLEIAIVHAKLHIQNRNGEAAVSVLKPLIKLANNSTVLKKEKSLLLQLYLIYGQSLYFSTNEAELFDMLSSKNADFIHTKDTNAIIQFNDLWVLWACQKYRFHAIPETYVAIAEKNAKLLNNLKNHNDFFISKNILSLVYLWNGELNKALSHKIENANHARKVYAHTNLITELNYQAFIYRCQGKLKAMEKVLTEAFSITNKVKSTYLIHLKANQLVGRIHQGQLNRAQELVDFLEKSKALVPPNYPLKFFWEGPLLRYYIEQKEFEKAHACLVLIFHPSQRAWPEVANLLNEKLKKAFAASKSKEFLKLAKELIHWSDSNQQGLV